MPVSVVVFTLLVATIAVVAVDVVRRKGRREQFIRSFMFPRGLFDKLAAARPGLAVKDHQLVARALRQFFLAYLKSGNRRVAMPSQVVDDLWHEFILFTRDYQVFCQTAFGTLPAPHACREDGRGAIAATTRMRKRISVTGASMEPSPDSVAATIAVAQAAAEAARASPGEEEATAAAAVVRVDAGAAAGEGPDGPSVHKAEITVGSG